MFKKANFNFKVEITEIIECFNTLFTFLATVWCALYSLQPIHQYNQTNKTVTSLITLMAPFL